MAAPRDTQDDIRKLMILLLLKLGSTSEEIALALGVGSSVIRKMMPTRKIKRITRTVED